MKDVKFILFDCMETLIDMHEIPGVREYARWAFEGSGNEQYWKNFDGYFQDYNDAVAALEDKYQDNKEYNLLERYDWIAKKINLEKDGYHYYVIDRFFKTFWKRYKKECYVKDEVYKALNSLSRAYGMGVVSNFLVCGGVEELLVYLGISEFFKFTIVSVDIGWKKPSVEIYQKAIEKTGVNAENVLFVGDDYDCDYLGPQRVGLRSILLDKHGRFNNVEERISNFKDLQELLQPRKTGRCRHKKSSG